MQKVVTNKGKYLMILISIFANVIWIGDMIYLTEVDIDKNSLMLFAGLNLSVILLAVTIYLILLKLSNSYYLIDDVYLTVHHKDWRGKLTDERIATSNIKYFGYYKEDPFEWYILTKQDTRIYLPVGIFAKKKIAKEVGVKLKKNVNASWFKTLKKDLSENVRIIITIIVGLIITIGSFFLHFAFDGNKILIGCLMGIDMIIMFIQVMIILMNDKDGESITFLKRIDKIILSIGAMGLFWVVMFAVLCGLYMYGADQSFHPNLLIFPCYLAPSCIIITILFPYFLEAL